MLAIESGPTNVMLGALKDVQSITVLSVQSHVCYTAWWKVSCLCLVESIMPVAVEDVQSGVVLPMV